MTLEQANTRATARGLEVTPTRVVVDGRALGDASSFRGIGSYLRGVLGALASREDVDLQVLATSSARLPDGVQRRPLPRIAPGRFADREHSWRLPRDLDRSGAEVALSPALDPPRTTRLPWVQTLHDVIPLAVADPSFAVERKRWERWAPRFRDAAAVIAISRFVGEQGTELLGLDPARVHVVHHGVAEVFHRTQWAPAEHEPYVLYVGEHDARKGYPEAFDVVAALAAAGLPHRLRVAGRLAPWVEPEVRRLVAAAPRPDLVDLLGHVHHEHELPALYAGASALLVTSRHEGFGLPALEAMAAGTPVVAFANTATEEVVRGGGELVTDGDSGAFAEVVVDLLRDPDALAGLAERCRVHASDATWDRCAARHAEVLRAAVG